MSDPNRQQLQQAYQLIKTGQKQEAGRILIAILKDDRNNADAWWLLANASPDPDKARQALEQVLRLRPNDTRAQQMLDKLNESMPPSERFSMPVSPPAETTPPPATPPASSDPFAMPASSSEPFSDPFAESAPTMRTSPPPALEDPFADPFAESAPTMRTSPPPPTGDLFGDPFASSTPPARDPFGDPFADPFAVPAPTPAPARTMPPPPPPRPAKKDDGCARTVLIILAIFGIIFVVAAVACFALSAAGINLFNQALQTALPPGTREAVIGDIQEMLTVLPNLTPGAEGVIGAIENKGSISTNQRINDTLPSTGFTNHGYSFEGSAGQNVTFTVTSSDFDTRLWLLGPDGEVIAENDDIDFANDNTNSRISLALPANGAYQIVVGDIGFDGGAYDLEMK